MIYSYSAVSGNWIIACNNSVFACNNSVIACNNSVIACNNSVIACNNSVIACNNSVSACNNSVSACNNSVVAYLASRRRRPRSVRGSKLPRIMPLNGLWIMYFLFFIINDPRRPAVRAGIAPTRTRPPPLPPQAAKAAQQSGKREAEHGRGLFWVLRARG